MNLKEEIQTGGINLNIGPKNEKALGPELLAAVNELAVSSSEFEELVNTQRMSVRDLLEYMEIADLIDVPLIQKISDLADRLFVRSMAKYSYISDQAKRNRKVDEEVGQPLNDALKACREGRPILSFLLFQANLVHSAGDFRERLKEHLGRKAMAPRNADPYFMEKKYLADMEKKYPDRNYFIKNEDQLVLLMTKAKQSLYRRPGNQGITRQLYKKFKTAVLEPATKGGGLEGPSDRSTVFTKAQLSFPKEQDVGGPLQLCQFSVFFTADQQRVFTGTVSRLDGELYFPGSVVAPLKPVFESQRELALYDELRAYIFQLLADGARGGIIRVHDIDAIELGPDAVEEVQGETEEKVATVQEPEQPETQAAPEIEAVLESAPEAESIPEPEAESPTKERFQKGVGTKLSGLDTQRIVSALESFGIQEAALTRGHHTILEKITPEGRITYPFPTGHGAGKETANMARILTKALKRFGIARDDFLRSYHKK